MQNVSARKQRPCRTTKQEAMTNPPPLICDCHFHSDGNHGITAITYVPPIECDNVATWIVVRESPIKRLESKVSCDECLDDMLRNHRRKMGLVALTPVAMASDPSAAAAIGDARWRKVLAVFGNQCWCFHGPTEPGLSGHEFTPIDEAGNRSRAQCDNSGRWLSTWQCGGCPETHTVQVCDACRTAHDADAATGLGAVIDWQPSSSVHDGGSGS